MEMVNIHDFLEENVHQGALREIHMNEGQDLKDSPVYIRPISDKEVTSSTNEKSSPSGRKLRMQKCSIEGCKEVTYKTRTSRSWVCRQHQSKLQKEMLKKRLQERCRTPISELQKSAATDKVPVLGTSTGFGGSSSICGNGGGGGGGSSGGPLEPSHASGTLFNSLRPSLLEEVLNEKKLGLMRSPEVIRFLRRGQKTVELRKRNQDVADHAHSGFPELDHNSDR